MAHLGRYRLDHPVGSGAFATVWRAYDPDLDTTVAVKILADNWARHADVRERFLAEARLLRQTTSRRVVRVHDVGVADDRPYFVMDFVPGGTLADRVGDLDPAEALRLAVESAEAVHVLHEAGFLHRDIKPGNLLLAPGPDGPHVVVADLGSAKRLADVSGFTITTGTPAYMAPEQAAGRTMDRRTDVYALGVVAYELCTGGRPDDRLRSGARLRDGWPPELDRQLPGVYATLEAALSLDPDRRPADALALARALRDAGEHPRPREWPAAAVWATALAVFVLVALASWLVSR